MEIKLDKQFADNVDKVLAERKAKRMSEPETVTIRSPGHEPVTMTSQQFSELATDVGNERLIRGICLEAAADLLKQNWRKIREIRDHDETASVDIAVKFSVDCSGPTPKIITKLSYAQKFKDEREDVLANDAQPGLGLSDKPA